MNMYEDNDNSVIIKLTIELARNPGYSVVAEGIENEVVYAVLQTYNCNFGQGFYISRPVPADKLKPCYQKITGVSVSLII